MFGSRTRFGVFIASCAALASLPDLAAADPALTTHDLALLNRITWGASASSAAEMSALGERRWLEQQLHPSPDPQLPPAVQQEIDALPISHTPMAELVVDLDAQGKATRQIADPDQKQVALQAYRQALADLGRQAATRSLLRDVYSANQLQEQMTWFWMNHFNVHMAKHDIRVTVGDYEDQAIRPRALGRFRYLLEATLRHPAMLRYLDNDQNAKGRINENYAREIMELHTMGVDSGYSQKDVQELARILTGVGVDLSHDAPRLKPDYQPLYVRAGLFEFNPNRHDFGDKVFLGHTIRGSGFGEVEQALDILSRQPATAHHISLELAAYFVGDNPPPALVDAMAQTFMHTDGDIASVLKILFASRAFDASLGGEFKDPVHYVVSSVRLAYDGRVILNTRPMENWLNRMGEGLYNHETPDGYPMTSAAWNGPGQMAVRFEIARQIGSGAPALFRVDDAPAPSAAMMAAPAPAPLPPPPSPPPTLQMALYQRGLGPSLSAPTLGALSQAGSPRDWNALFLSSPEFMRR